MSLRTWPWLLLAACIVAFDQASKYWIVATLEYGVQNPIFPGFYLTLLHNTGAAFSMFADGSGWQRWLFIAIAVGVSAWIYATLRRMPRGARWMPAAFALVLGGALGNCWDRAVLGYVVDFVQLCWRTSCFPAFNVADSAITVGAAMIILDMLRPSVDRAAGTQA